MKTENSSKEQAALLASLPDKTYFGFTRRQIRLIACYGLFNVFRGIYIIIIGPFYPPEAADRGISTSTSGIVIGSYNLAAFLCILLHGGFLIPRYGPQRVFILSTSITSVCAVLFGCLGFINDRQAFIVCSFILRIIGGAGDAGFYPAAYAVFAEELPNLVSTTIGIFEIFFGIGAICGPILCGSIIDIIGFKYVYILLGSCLMVSSILVAVLTPLKKSDGNQTQTDSKTGDRKCGYGKLLRLSDIQFGITSLFSAGMGIGFIVGTLRVHLEQFNLSSMQIGAVFSVFTGIYTLFSLAWGFLSDKSTCNKIVIIASGSFLTLVAFSLFGPLSLLLKSETLWVTLFGLGLHGIGIGSSIIATFAYASESAVKKSGYADTAATNGLVSSILQLPFALGNAVGPAAASALFEKVGFQLATFSVIGFSLVVIIFAVLLLACKRPTGGIHRQIELTL